MILQTGPESRFTAPRPDCEHPEYWHSTDDDSTEIEVSALVAAFVTALQPEFVLETGSAWGQTAEAIGRALRANGHGYLVTIEPDYDRAMFTRERCTTLPVTVHIGSSLDYTPPEPVDFLWSDSLFGLRPLELERFQPYASPCCVVGIHDTGPQHPLRPTLRPLERSGLLESPLYLPTPRGVCFARLRRP